jgi:hypothetical protein
MQSEVPEASPQIYDKNRCCVVCLSRVNLTGIRAFVALFQDPLNLFLDWTCLPR